MSVVRNVASASKPPPGVLGARKGESWRLEGVSLCRVKDWGMGACIHNDNEILVMGSHEAVRSLTKYVMEGGRVGRSGTSGKSTQKAPIFNPYKKLPKHSLNLPKLSFSNWRCMKFASKSAMESLNSANPGSRDARGNSPAAPVDAPRVPEGVVWEARREVREGGRRGVVGREGMLGRDWEVERWRVEEGGRSRGVVEIAVADIVLVLRRGIVVQCFVLGGTSRRV